MNIKRLCQETTAEAVAEYLQMEMKHTGGRTYILCPGHEARLGRPDSRMGNAVLCEHGYYCFACSKFIPTYQMVMEYTNCSAKDAYNLMAEAMGGAELFEGDESEVSLKLPRCRLTSDEARIIGLSSKPTAAIQTEKGKVVQDGLSHLYMTNPKMYYDLIISSAASSQRKYEYCKKHYSSVSSDLAYQLYDLLGSVFDHSIYKKLERELTERIEICEKICKIFAAAKRKENLV